MTDVSHFYVNGGSSMINIKETFFHWWMSCVHVCNIIIIPHHASSSYDDNVTYGVVVSFIIEAQSGLEPFMDNVLVSSPLSQDCVCAKEIRPHDVLCARATT